MSGDDDNQNENHCKQLHCKDGETIVKDSFYYQLLRDQYLSLIKGAIHNNPSYEQERCLDKIKERYQTILTDYKQDTEIHIINAIIDVYADNDSYKLSPYFNDHDDFFNYLMENYIISSDLSWLSDVENFMWTLSSATDNSTTIKKWAKLIKLHDLSKWKLYQLPSLMTILPENFVNICFDVCSKECDCLVSQVTKIISNDQQTNNLVKIHCLRNETNTNTLPDAYNRDKYKYLWKRLCRHIYDNKHKFKKSIDDALIQFPKELVDLCFAYIFLV